MTANQEESVKAAVLEVMRDNAYMSLFVIAAGVAVAVGSLVPRSEIQYALEALLAEGEVERERTSHDSYRWRMAE